MLSGRKLVQTVIHTGLLGQYVLVGLYFHALLAGGQDVSTKLLLLAPLILGLRQLANMYNSIQAALAGAERVFEIIDTPAEADDAPDAVPLKSIVSPLRWTPSTLNPCDVSQPVTVATSSWATSPARPKSPSSEQRRGGPCRGRPAELRV